MDEVELIFYPFIFLLGLAMGSFGNVLIYRLPRRLSIANPPSNCPACKSAIHPRDNIPILSYILLRGRCRNCGAGISIRYPLVELLTAVLFTAIFWKYGLKWEFLYFVFFGFIMVIHAFIDYEHYLLLDTLNAVLFIIGATGRVLISEQNFMEGTYGFLAGGGLLALVYVLIYVIFRKEGMGFGDIKTAAVMGIFLGPIGVIFMFIISSVLGIILGVVRSVMGKGNLVPFGAMMAPGGILIVFLDDWLKGLLF